MCRFKQIEHQQKSLNYYSICGDFFVTFLVLSPDGTLEIITWCMSCENLSSKVHLPVIALKENGENLLCKSTDWFLYEGNAVT